MRARSAASAICLPSGRYRICWRMLGWTQMRENTAPPITMTLGRIPVALRIRSTPTMT